MLTKHDKPCAVRSQRLVIQRRKRRSVLIDYKDGLVEHNSGGTTGIPLALDEESVRWRTSIDVLDVAFICGSR